MHTGADDENGGLEIDHAHPSRAIDEAALAVLISRAVEGEEFTIRSLGIVLADHETVHRLNREYLAHDYVTDVLSFSLDEEATADRVIDGEVYVDLDTAAERAPEFGTTFEDEVRRYVVHGLLHLMGYDDATDAERAAMRRLEDHYLSGSVKDEE